MPVNAESFHAPALPRHCFFVTLEKDDRLAHVRCHVCSRKRNFRAAFASNRNGRYVKIPRQGMYGQTEIKGSSDWSRTMGLIDETVKKYKINI